MIVIVSHVCIPSASVPLTIITIIIIIIIDSNSPSELPASKLRSVSLLPTARRASHADDADGGDDDGCSLTYTQDMTFVFLLVVMCWNAGTSASALTARNST